MMSERAPKVRFAPVADVDFDRLADLRVAAMRESLERLGRFNPERARERLRSAFSPEHTRFIIFKEQKVGFYAARPSPEGLRLDHLYVHPDFQSRGIGEVVLKKIFEEADRDATPVLVGALRESASNRFYQRHGFAQTSESEWDIYYIRPPSNNEKTANQSLEPTPTAGTSAAEQPLVPAAVVAHL